MESGFFYILFTPSRPRLFQILFLDARGGFCYNIYSPEGIRFLRGDSKRKEKTE